MEAAAARRTVDLRALYQRRQEEMLAGLGIAKEHVGHPTLKGDATETEWVELFETYLPKRYHAARATVVDAEGNASDAIDVVVFDRQYSPFLLNHKGTLYIPAESVYAVLEIKQSLSAAHIHYAADKAASVRSLRRTSAPIVHAGGTLPPRTPPEILAGILGSHSDWRPPFGDAFRKSLQGTTGNRRLDLGCALADGAFEVGKQSNIEAWEGDALMRFFLTLLRRLQDFGTAPAIDLKAYARVLDS